jgi:hypothetical protein
MGHGGTNALAAASRGRLVRRARGPWVAGAVAGTVSRAHASLGHDGEALAKKSASNLGAYVATQGWIATH